MVVNNYRTMNLIRQDLEEPLTRAGYVQVGMDHFALPHDDLARAEADGTLTRNFMGYTTVGSSDVVALGTSGISDVAGVYARTIVVLPLTNKTWMLTSCP